MKRVDHLSWVCRAVVLTVAVIATTAMTSAIAFAGDDMINYVADGGYVRTIAASHAFDITDASGKVTLEDSKTYVIHADKTFDDSVEVKGDATLILRNGVTATAKKGIRCSRGNSIMICSETASSSKLVAIGEKAAGIGGSASEDCGRVVICGGTVEAKSYVDAAGIGGGRFSGDGGDVQIYDATVVATGTMGAAGIGGSCTGDGGDVTIVRSNVTAEGTEGLLTGDGGAGIGGGSSSNFTDAGDGGHVRIVDSVVKATGSGDGAGIGGGGDHWCDPGDQGDGGDVTIEGDSVVDACSGGAGSAIGRGDDEGDPGKVTLGDDLMVTDQSRDVGTIARVSEREGYCYYRRHVKIDPCTHERTGYEKTDTTHQFRCAYCAALDEAAEPHNYNAFHVCRTCLYTVDSVILPNFGQ